MHQPTPDINPTSPKARAKVVILKTLGVAKVAAWCGVGEMTVYQWLQRGTDEKPIPTDHVPTIVKAARAEGFEVDPHVLWPAMEGIA